MILIDTHAHLTMPEFNDIQDVADRAKQSSVSAIINVGFDLESSYQCVELANKYDFMFASVGIHPHNALEEPADKIEQIKILADNKNVVAIGETGLDYYQNNRPVEAQIESFISHIELAKQLNLPLIIHGRDSCQDIIAVLKENLDPSLRGVFHCFAGDIDSAKEAVGLGFYISFTGIITFKNAHDMRAIVKYVPLEKMLIETDSPYLAPQQFRGKRNEPSYLHFIAEKIAEIKNEDIERVASITTDNSIKLFGLQPLKHE